MALASSCGFRLRTPNRAPFIPAGRIGRPPNVLQYLSRHAWQLGNVHRDQECLVAREQLGG